MTPERWKQVDRVLQEALEFPVAERAAFLDQVCAKDPELRREVESLMDFHEQASGFIEEPPADIAADWKAARESRVGESLGHYHLVKQVGRGGMGEVYLARDTRLGRRVALKLLPPRFMEDSRRVQRFQQEARAASGLNHPNIITIHEIGEVKTGTGQVHFIATEFIEGQTLRAVIASGGIKLSEVIEVGLQATNALAAAHAAGIVHRDIKPENIMLRPDGYVKVLDFGLAKLSEQTSESTLARIGDVETDPGIILGTVSYMSPEQARGGTTDARSDIFSLGIVLYEMISSHRPFSGSTAADIIATLIGREPDPLTRYRPEIPVEVQNVVSRMLEKDPADRYQSADDLRQALKNLKKSLSSADVYSTREFSGLSQLVERLNRDTNEIARAEGAEPGAPTRVTSSISLFITRFIGSPKPLMITGVVLVLLLAAAFYGRRWMSGATPRIESIAVLPAKPLLASARDETLEMGIADTLITKLSGLQRLSVRPLSAVRKYTSLDQDPIVAGQELQTQAVLENIIQRVGDRVRVTARLISIPDGKVIWTRQFDEQWTNIFVVQDAISQRVADDLVVPLTGEERTELTKSYTTDPAAYALYLEGRVYWNKRTSQGMQKAVEFFQKAIDKDPRYALAYVGLADAYATLGSYKMSPPRETFSLAEDAAREALKLDPNLAEAHASMGKIYTDFVWDWRRAEDEFLTSIKLRPNYANSHHWYSTLLIHLGRLDEAVAEARKALELDFLSPVASTQLGQVLYRARRYDEAVDVLRATLEREPTFVTARVYLGLCYVFQNKLDAALDEFLRVRLMTRNQPGALAMVGYVYALKGDHKEALKAEEELKEMAKTTWVSPFSRSAIPSAMGRTDEVFMWLDRCFEERDSSIRGLKTDPLFDRIRNDRRFPALLERAHLQ